MGEKSDASGRIGTASSQVADVLGALDGIFSVSSCGTGSAEPNAGLSLCVFAASMSNTTRSITQWPVIGSGRQLYSMCGAMPKYGSSTTRTLYARLLKPNTEHLRINSEHQTPSIERAQRERTVVLVQVVGENGAADAHVADDQCEPLALALQQQRLEARVHVRVRLRATFVRRAVRFFEQCAKVQRTSMNSHTLRNH